MTGSPGMMDVRASLAGLNIERVIGLKSERNLAVFAVKSFEHQHMGSDIP